MTSEEKVWQAARFLHEAHRARTPYQPLPDGISPRDINEAYDIQEAFHELLFPERGAIVGYKVALTTTVMQQMVGFGHPASGAVFTSGVHHSPVSINASDYVHVGAECEIAMLLEEKTTIPAVKAQLEYLATTQESGFWEGIDLNGLEELRLRLRGLVPFLDKKKRKIV